MIVCILILGNSGRGPTKRGGRLALADFKLLSTSLIQDLKREAPTPPVSILLQFLVGWPGALSVSHAGPFQNPNKALAPRERVPYSQIGRTWGPSPQ